MSDTTIDQAIIGQPASLKVETDRPIADRVDIHFESSVPGSSPDFPAEVVQWDETKLLITEVSPQPAPNKHAYVVKWQTTWHGTDAQLDTHPKLKFEVRGQATAGGKVAGVSRNVIALRRPIEITSNVDLTRIMKHEFATLADGGNFKFYTIPVQRFLNSLTVQQQKLLLSHPVGASGHRLVVFITLYPPTKSRLMGADFTDEATAAVPNAYFTVFHCQGPGKDVTLVCHTEHFLVNERNPDTKKLLSGPQANLSAAEWQSKSTNSPVKFKIAAMAPNKAWMRGMVLHRVFTADGKDVMHGNTIHGMINTKGCWMLFRNFNWPKSKYRDLDIIYRTAFRPMREKPNWPELRRKLAPVGYDAEPGTALLSSSLEKFLNYDRNHAYGWFVHDLVGIKYFSSAFDGWGYFPSTQKAEGDFNFVNDYKSHGEVFEKQFPYSEAGKAPTQNLADEGSNAYHDFFVRKKTDPKFTVNNSLWRVNALGFQTATQFAPETPGDAFPNLDKAKLEACSWADLYIYRDNTTPPGGL